MTQKKLPLPPPPLPDDYRLRNRLGYRLSRLSRIMQAKLERDLAPHGMNRLKWCVLSGVGLEGQASPSDLATHIGITRPATSRLLRAMEKEGLIARALTPKDGRAREIQVTDLGRAQLAACWPLVNHNDSHFVSKLAADDLVGLFLALDQLMGGEVAELDDF